MKIHSHILVQLSKPKIEMGDFDYNSSVTNQLWAFVFILHLMSTYYMLNIVLSARGTAMEKVCYLLSRS